MRSSVGSANLKAQSTAVSLLLSRHKYFMREPDTRCLGYRYTLRIALISVACLISILFIREEKVHELNA